MSNKNFAAFIMTYERPEILADTIKKLFDQTLPPEKILVVDNSSSYKTREIVQGMDSRVTYFRRGYNSGPAGAAKVGLEILAHEGYRWIYWGDDNDPPNAENCFEKLISLAENYTGKCGQVGVVGHRINKYTGLMRRTADKDLFDKEFLEVDNVGGGQCKIVNAQAILDGILPDDQLFFGLEELDFDLSLKKAGYRIIVHNELFKKCREMYGKMNYKRILSTRKNENAIQREYYSNRNLLYIFKKNKYYLGVYFILIRIVLKCLVSYKYGLKYGFGVTKNSYSAIIDFSKSRYYQRVSVISKD